MSYWRDKVALITGGSAGLGRAIAEAFAAAGAKVVISARDEAKLNAVREEMRASGKDVTGIAADVTRQEQVDSLFSETASRFQRLDVLVNNAGQSSRGNAWETSPDEFRSLLELNFLALVRCTQTALAQLMQSKGHLVNIGSLSAKTATRYLGAYPASKFPVAAYSQQLRYELGPKGVHVLLVCPGPIVREDAGQRYTEEARDLPDAAGQPGGGVRLKGIPASLLAARILRACEKRQAELVVPARARLVFAISELWPTVGDWIIQKMTK